MTTQFLQAQSNQTAAFNASGLRVCFVVVPFVHKLVNAWLLTSNVVTTGTVEVQLKNRDVNDAQGGSNVGTKLENDDLEDWSVTNKRFALTLSADDMATSPAMRTYFWSFTATNSADRLDEPILLLEVEEIG
ncbi:hypothetical protein LCGC14_0734200 [marine sediment metagenome]|uniref:Uncharacterized protein n=1 Tax=marine sediment metagenome TaxID=412755 RepID=A0A0F9TG05_9ZZZZ